MLILLALLLAFSSIFAMDIEIGNGTTTTSYIPMYGLWEYSWSTFIIDADLIGMEVDFNQIQVNVSNAPASYLSSNQKIYFKNTTASEVTDAYPNPETSGFTLVYDGDITWNGGGWQGVMLDVPFEYNGTDNLQIVWENNHGAWSTGYPSFYTTEAGSTVSAYDYSDGSFPTEAGTTATFYPNLKLSYAAENEPTIATLVAPENGAQNVATTTTLQWTLGDNTTDVDVYFADNAADVSSMASAAMVVDGQNVTSYEATDLDNLTTYFWRVTSRNSSNDLEVTGPVWSFTTEAGGGLVAVSIGDGTTSAYNYPWNFFYKNSVSETIYLASELNIGGQLQGLTFYNNFATDITASPVNIWVGETTQTDLATAIPASNLTAVFSGDVDFPSGQNLINIMFDTPYNYAGGNLVVLTEREMDTEYYSSGDKFYNTETDLANRTMYWQSDNVDLDPETVTAGTVVANMPNVTFYFITEGMGSVTGTVTDGTTGLEGVNLVIDGTNYQTMSTADGSFEFPYVAEGEDYSLTASLHGYNDATAIFDVVEDQETEVDVTMVMLDNVEVSGQVITNDTGLGIQAHVMLTGYETYEVDTDANGNFTITGVYTNQTYTGTATAEGYQPGAFQAVVGETDLDVGDVIVTETLFPASNVVAALDGDDAVVTWDAPNPNVGESISEGFEEAFPPADWTTVVNNTTESWAQYETVSFTSGDVVPTEGMYQAGVMWDYSAQDEWLITNSMNCPAGNLTFDFYGHYGSTNGDNYYVKVSTDGTNWTPIWNATDLPEADNHYDTPVSIDLSAYAGQNVQFAWNFVDGDGAGLWYASYIDNINIGGRRIRANELTAVSKAPKTNNVTRITRNKKDANEPAYMPMAGLNSTRAFESYNVYRFLIEDEDTMANWTLVEEETTALTYTDTDWSTLDVGFYKYAVRAVYTNGVEANASISNWLQNSAMADVTINVDSNLGDVIADANIALMAQTPNPDGEYDMYDAITDASGTAVITVNVGMYDISITATGYTGYTGEIDATNDVTLDVTLDEVALPPTGVVAEQEGEDALITWNEPGGAGSGEWITKGADENNDGIGTNSAAVISVSQMYTEAELADYQGMYINTIKFFPREATASYTVKVWGGTNGDVELASQTVPEFTNEVWNEVALDAAAAIPAVGPVYIGYVADTPTGFPAGCDAGPAVAGGDMIKLGDQATWDVLSEITTIDVNWNIQAYVSWSRGGQVASAEGKKLIQKHNPEITQRAEIVRGNLAPIANPTTVVTRELMGYKVWRLLSIDQGNEANWTLLTSDMITDLTYTDTDWDALASGSYKFAVKAVYTNDNMSSAAFSNVLLKDMYGTVDGMVMSGTAPINGATVTLDGNAVNTDGSGYFLFENVLAGEYVITASAAGYVSATQNITVVGTQLTSVDFNLEESNILFSDGFESYPDFSLTADPWVIIDGDLSTTYGINGVDWTGAYDPMGFMVFNPLMTTPPLAEDYYAYEGSKYMTSWAATEPANNDWLISQEFTLSETGSFNFWAKSIMADYGLERFNVLVSNGSTNPNDFTSISGDTYIQAPISWTQYSYSLDDYANQTIRVAIQCVSDDAFIFMVDNVEVDAPGGEDVQDNNIAAVSQLIGNYPNPFNPETRIAFSTKENGPVSIDIYNIKGQKVRSLLNEYREAGAHDVVWNGKDDNGKSVASGVFFYRMKSGKYSSTKKMILMK